MKSLGSIFADLRVLDLSSNFAGPLACQIFGDLGADVIKVEKSGAGEDTRSLPPFRASESTVFRSVNRNKRSIVLDLAGERGRDAILRLARSADIVVHSFRPGSIEKLRLGYEAFRDANPAIIYCSISAFGTGKLGRDKPGYDALVQAFTGMMALTGHRDRPPARVPIALVDLSTGLWATIGIMAALHRRQKMGVGEQVEVSLVDTGFQLLSHQILGLLATGEAPSRTGSAGPSAAPYETFETAAGWLMIAVANDGLFKKLCEATGLQELVADSRFSTAASRVTHRDVLHELIQESLTGDSASVWAHRLSSAGVPAAPVNELADALADPVSNERLLLSSPEGDDFPVVRLPLDNSRSARKRRPPKLGEHTLEVLKENGFTKDEMAYLAQTDKSLERTEV